MAAVFPALYRPLDTGHAGEAVLTEQDASCFYHPEKKAHIVCEGCGRFLCALCDIPLAGRHLCATCIETGKKKGRLQHIGRQRLLYDDIALAVAVLPMLVWFVTFITAPIAIYIALRYWKTPTSILHRTKIRYVLAIVFAGLELVGWTAVVFFIVRRRG